MNAEYTKNHVTKKVKNLGWCLRYASSNIIKKIRINKHNGTYGVGGHLTVYFDDGVEFDSEFADFGVLCNWLKSRESWRGVTVHYSLYNQITNTYILGE